MSKLPQNITLRIILTAPLAGVDFGIQQGKGSQYTTVQTQRSAGEDLTFELNIALKWLPEEKFVFAGPFAQGPPDERFVYIDIGTAAKQFNTPWSRRLKIPLKGITRDLLLPLSTEPTAILEIRVPGTGKDGGPNCGTFKTADGWKPVKP